jgi:hypothetical protein
LSLESNALSIHFGKPLDEDLLAIIDKAILDQIEPIAEQLPNFKK